MMTDRPLALDRFVHTHPPADTVSPAPGELVAGYKGIVPDSLLELWQRKGLGFYGRHQIALLDPRPWQPVLDRWLAQTSDTVKRVPIALTAYGTLLYYRRMTEQDEDVVCINPTSSDTQVLSYGLDDFFNVKLCRPDLPSPMVPPVEDDAGRELCGLLGDGEVYEIDQMLFSMHMLQIKKVDALSMHCRLRDKLDLPERQDDKPQTFADALPAEFRQKFADIEQDVALTGIYFSSYVDYCRLLVLGADNRYQLLFWTIDNRTFERKDIRMYEGMFESAYSSKGDHVLMLSIVLGQGSLGSDDRDQGLVSVQSQGQEYLLRTDSLSDIVRTITHEAVLGRSEYYFRRIKLGDTYQEEPHGGRPTPRFNDLPPTLQMLILAEPLVVTITEVGDFNEDEGAILCTINMGREDGLLMNMPFYAAAGRAKKPRGWVWEVEPHCGKISMTCRRLRDGTLKNPPAVGDVLTSRSPKYRIPE